MNPPAPAPTARAFFRQCERITRNFLAAALVVVCVYAVRAADIPSAASVAAAAASVTQTPWEEELGRIRFVDHMLPDAVSVFFGDLNRPALKVLNQSPVLHPYTQNEPYLSLQSTGAEAYALTDGTVCDVKAETDGTVTLTLAHADGFETRYFGLKSTFLSAGDTVGASSPIGTLSANGVMAFALYEDGLPIDPTGLLQYPTHAL